MDICGKRGRRLRECIVDGLNCLCAGKPKDVQSHDKREQKETGALGGFGLGPHIEEWKKELDMGIGKNTWEAKAHTDFQHQPDFHGLFYVAESPTADSNKSFGLSLQPAMQSDLSFPVLLGGKE